MRRRSFSGSENTIQFLCYNISPEGIQMDQGKVDTIQEWPLPQSVKELQRFLGFANFYRHFIRQFSWLMAPLTSLLCGKPKSPAAPHQARLYLLTLNTPSLSSLPFTYLNQARPIVLACVFSLPQTFLFLHSSDSPLFQVSPARKQRTVTASSAIWILTHLALLTSRHLLVISPLYFNKYPCFVHLPLCLLACVVTLIIRRL